MAPSPPSSSSSSSSSSPSLFYPLKLAIETLQVQLLTYCSCHVPLPLLEAKQNPSQGHNNWTNGLWGTIQAPGDNNWQPIIDRWGYRVRNPWAINQCQEALIVDAKLFPSPGSQLISEGSLNSIISVSIISVTRPKVWLQGSRDAGQEEQERLVEPEEKE
uniref:HDC19552 n=1 Tax=Drosophila melanogaster TaxID=7227 RepID=Q6II69_DROME|nr:TPA_inf: HDC19552 [Drosophila melanogaster]